MKWISSLARGPYQLLKVLLSTENEFRDPEVAARKFISQYESCYGDNHAEFMITSYSKALDIAKREFQFMIAYIHSSEHDDTPQFCRSIINQGEFSRFLKDNRIVFWGGDICHPEAYQGNLE